MKNKNKLNTENKLTVVSNYCIKHGIEDEDLKQELYLLSLTKDFTYASLYSAIKVKIKNYANIVIDKEMDCLIDEVMYMPISDNFLSEIVKESINERELKLVRMRFGFEDGKPKTLDEVAKQFGCSIERVRQNEAKALHKIRKRMSKENLKFSDF